MSSQIKIGSKNAGDYFFLEPLFLEKTLSSFNCSVAEYNEYLFQDAMRSQKDHIAKTWLLREQETGSISAYMSLIADAIKLSFTEKELHNLDYPFRTIPAMKIAKLAVDKNCATKYKGIGTFMLQTAERLAWGFNNDYCACRFITVDADIEHNKSVIEFYRKNGFIPNTEKNNKHSKTISMRKDIWV
jgi:ribosomal protein S18 acetylase RimI-like enzyme